jgi:G:T/U mismatch-specific DNA glycosylase
MFWYILSMAGAIEEDRSFLRNDENLKRFYHEKFGKEYRFGLVNLVDRPTRDVSELRDGEEMEGNARLERIIKTYRPTVICFVGKITYEKFSGSRNFDF